MARAARPAPTTPRKRPVQQRAEVTVDAIVVAVERILERDGADALTTNRIAEVAGVSIGSLYHYFPNKESLVRALSQRYLDEALAKSRALIAAAATLTLPQLVDAIGMALVGVDRELRPIHRWLYELRTSAGFHDQVRTAFDALVADVAAFLAARPELAVPDARAAAFVVVHAIEGLVSALATRPAVARPPIAAQAIAMLSAYFRTLAR